MKWRGVGLAGLLAWGTTLPAAAQPHSRDFPPPNVQSDVRRHDGLFLRQGLGLGLLRSRGRNEPAEGSSDQFSVGPAPVTRMRANSAAGAVAHIAMGGTPVSGLVLALELASHMFWDIEVETEEQRAAQTPTFFRRESKYISYGALVVWYPVPTGGFSAGVAAALASAHANGPTGWLAGPELGYSWWVGEQWSIGALLRLSFSALDTSERRQFDEFIGGTTAYIALPSLTGVVTFH